MARIALVGSTDFNSEHFGEQSFDRIIAVDGGYASLTQAGFVPDAAVGDFDSLGFVPDDCPVLLHPVHKDASDMELALDEFAAHAGDEAVMYGAFAGRLDHTLANLQLLVGCARRGVRAFGIGDDFVITALAGGSVDRIAFAAGVHAACLSAESKYGTCLSVFAQGGATQGVTEEGLAYALDHAELSEGVSLGLSNEFVSGHDASVGLEKGAAVVTFPLAAWDFMG